MFDKLLTAVAKLIGSPIGVSGRPARTKPRKTGAALRNPADSHQAARIEAAAAKRQRKAEKLNRDSFRSFDYDGTIEAYDQKRQPFYIAK